MVIHVSRSWRASTHFITSAGTVQARPGYARGGMQIA